MIKLINTHIVGWLRTQNHHHHHHHHHRIIILIMIHSITLAYFTINMYKYKRIARNMFKCICQQISLNACKVREKGKFNYTENSLDPGNMAKQ